MTTKQFYPLTLITWDEGETMQGMLEYHPNAGMWANTDAYVVHLDNGCFYWGNTLQEVLTSTDDAFPTKLITISLGGLAHGVIQLEEDAQSFSVWIESHIPGTDNPAFFSYGIDTIESACKILWQAWHEYQQSVPKGADDAISNG